MDRILVSGPSITEKEVEYVADAARNAWYSDANKYHHLLERDFARYIGRKYAIALPSATSAIHLSLVALGIGRGDEVVVPDTTWIATSAPISYVGARPVFADVARDTWCITAESLEKVITPKTKAIIPVDLYGGMPDMDALREIAQKHDLMIIEDAAEAIGSEYKGRKAGSFGETSVFSFHGSKTMTTGEGGMLVTDDETIANDCLLLRDHGRVPGQKMFWNDRVAFKYKMSSMQAALGLAQLERIEELVARKRQIFSWYQRELASVSRLAINIEPPGVKNSYWMVTAVWERGRKLPKEELIEIMSKRGIDTRPFFYPLSSEPAYSRTARGRAAKKRNLVSYEVSPFGINLPSGLRINQEDVHFVCEELKAILG